MKLVVILFIAFLINVVYARLLNSSSLSPTIESSSLSPIKIKKDDGFLLSNNNAVENVFTWPMDLAEAMKLAQCVQSVYAYKDWVFFGCPRDNQVTVFVWENNRLHFHRRIALFNSPGFGRMITVDHSAQDTNHLLILSTNQVTLVPYDKTNQDWMDITKLQDCTTSVVMLSDQSQGAMSLPSVILSSPGTDQVNIASLTWDSGSSKCTWKMWDTQLDAPVKSKSFGTSLALSSGNWLYIGAPLDADDTCSNYKGGNVHVYDIGQKKFLKRIQPSEAIEIDCSRNPKFGMTMTEYPGTGTGMILGMQDLSTDGYVFYYDGTKLTQIMKQAYAGRQMSAFKTVLNVGGQTKMFVCTIGAKHLWCYVFEDQYLLDIPFENTISYSQAIVSKYGLVLGGTNYMIGNSTMYAPTPSPTAVPTYEPTTPAPPTPSPTHAPTNEPTPAPTYEPTFAPTEAPNPKNNTAKILIGVLSSLLAIGIFGLITHEYCPYYNPKRRYKTVGSKMNDKKPELKF